MKVTHKILWVIFLMDLLPFIFIKNLNINKGIKLAKENGVDFSLKEAEIIVPFLKNNAHLVSLEHKRELLDKIKPNVNEITFGKIQQLLKNLHF